MRIKRVFLLEENLFILKYRELLVKFLISRYLIKLEPFSIIHTKK